MKPIDPQKLRAMEAAAREIGKLLEHAMRDYQQMVGGEKWGFGLLIFSFGDGPELTWISNSNRADMVRMMQEFITANPPDQTSEARN